MDENMFSSVRNVTFCNGPQGAGIHYTQSTKFAKSAADQLACNLANSGVREKVTGQLHYTAYKTGNISVFSTGYYIIFAPFIN